MGYLRILYSFICRVPVGVHRLHWARASASPNVMPAHGPSTTAANGDEVTGTSSPAHPPWYPLCRTPAVHLCRTPAVQSLVSYQPYTLRTVFGLRPAVHPPYTVPDHRQACRTLYRSRHRQAVLPAVRHTGCTSIRTLWPFTEIMARTVGYCRLAWGQLPVVYRSATCCTPLRFINN